MKQNSTFNQRKLVIALVLGLFMFSTSLYAQDEEDKFGLNVSLNSDIFFGYYPFFAGSYKASDNLDFTFYGILWSGGVGGGWGNWTEFGVGVGFPVGETLYVNPQIGLLNGSLTSGLGTPSLVEGIVPNLTVALSNDQLEGELYAGYYLGFERDDPVDAATNNYFHWWINSGYGVGKFISVGLHFEQLRYAGGIETDGAVADLEAVDLYTALGPYIKFADPDGGAYAKFIAGGDLRSDGDKLQSGNDLSNFFKLTVGYSF